MGRDKEVRKKDLDVDGKCFTLRRSLVSFEQNEVVQK